MKIKLLWAAYLTAPLMHWPSDAQMVIFFTHLIAVAPGRLSPPSPPTGSPRILIAHGTRDNVYSVYGSKYYIVPYLKSDGYDVAYHEFDGPHWVPEPVARYIFNWIAH